MTPNRRRLRLAGTILVAIVATLASLAFWFAVFLSGEADPHGIDTPIEQPYRWR